MGGSNCVAKTHDHSGQVFASTPDMARGSTICGLGIICTTVHYLHIGVSVNLIYLIKAQPESP